MQGRNSALPENAPDSVRYSRSSFPQPKRIWQTVLFTSLQCYRSFNCCSIPIPRTPSILHKILVIYFVGEYKKQEGMTMQVSLMTTRLEIVDQASKGNFGVL